MLQPMKIKYLDAYQYGTFNKEAFAPRHSHSPAEFTSSSYLKLYLYD